MCHVFAKIVLYFMTYSFDSGYIFSLSTLENSLIYLPMEAWSLLIVSIMNTGFLKFSLLPLFVSFSFFKFLKRKKKSITKDADSLECYLILS